MKADVQAIIGGDEVTTKSFSYTVALKKNGKFYCSGSIIDENHVITAARCLISDGSIQQQYPAMQVVVGTNNYKTSESKGKIFDVTEFHVPTEYFSIDSLKERVGDIAVLKLKQTIDLSKANKFARKVELDTDPTRKIKAAMISGFGWSSIRSVIDPKTGKKFDVVGSSGKLKKALVSILPSDECAAQKNKLLTDNAHLCARLKQIKPKSGQGLCKGDGGAPLVFGDILVAVASTNDEICDESKNPGMYTKIANYADFIKRAMNGTPRPDIFSIELPIK
ncbi:hypothetical protein QAD02_015291 [Eretmocerus hayati]|uniref:Uncharacterized protein n=1 Tax=Eretmocerus hayati TaxID=131215 RepID=A0ACC2PAB5_9HYME|nr:hypothetical protein QAD02_015291 [Eretmocerus hayati]